MVALAMFPGQGSQYVGMGSELLKQFPYVEEVFEEAEDAARLSIRKLCLEGPEKDLTLTAHTQPSILTVSIAFWRVLTQESGLDPQYFAGHSLGEYSALVAAGRLSFSRAVYLVHQRGKAMQEAVPQGLGAMAAILNADISQLEILCTEVSSKHAVVELANYNSPQQVVIAGHRDAVVKVTETMAEQKKRCVMLPVSAPFHSSLMVPARDKMEPLLRDTEFLPQSNQIFSNVTGDVVDYSAEHLIQQIDHPVRWTQTLGKALELGVTAMVEVGPGKVLTGLGRRMVPKESFRLISTDDIVSFLDQWS